MVEKALTRKILLFALIARIIVFGAASQGIFLIGEGRTQANLAENLLGGRGFMISRSMMHPIEEENAPPMFRKSIEFYRRVDGYYGALRPEQPTMFLVPGYAFFMAGIFAVFGQGNYLAVRGIQLLLGLLTVLIGLKIAGRFLSGRYLYFAGLFFALDPFELYYEALPATQALFSLLFLLGIFVSLRIMERSLNGGRYFMISALDGVVWAAAFYARPASLPVMVWLLMILPFTPLLKRFIDRLRGTFEKRRGKQWFSRNGLLAAITILVVFSLLMLPWGIRNSRISGTFRIMPAQGGVNLWEYNGRIFTDHFLNEARGALLLYSDLRDEYIDRLNSPELAEFPEFRDEPEWVRDSILYERNIRFMLDNPVLTLRLISLRFVEFFKPFPLNSFSPFYTIAGLLVLFWVLFFLWGGAVRCLLENGAEGFFLATVVAGYSLMHLLTASGTPHRVAIDFPMAIAAMCGVRYSVRRYLAWKEQKYAG
ncbi:MAG: glycosyltransferase family 39 protein [Candidatus Aegiribacteria sp.]|nr:glycosyltransferase family 39 protein [Candidatus Aegiribacteria sp.]